MKKYKVEILLRLALPVGDKTTIKVAEQIVEARNYQSAYNKASRAWNNKRTTIGLIEEV